MPLKYEIKRTLRNRIVRFWELRLEGSSPLFTFQQFVDFVDPNEEKRPNTPGRTLEVLRKEGVINYVAEGINYKNRRASVYKALPL